MSDNMHTEPEELTEDQRYNLACSKAQEAASKAYWDMDHRLGELEEEYGLDYGTLEDYRLR
jgi:transposase